MEELDRGEGGVVADRIGVAINSITITEYIKKKAKSRTLSKGLLHFEMVFEVRTQVLNDDWRDTLCRWYPSMTRTEKNVECAA